jgi:tRNA(Ser,Leu) C12 N-acetylase TAN1
MTRKEIQEQIIKLIKEISEKQHQIWKLTKRRDKLDLEKRELK